MNYVCSESLSGLRIESEDDEPVGMKMWSRPGEEGYGGGGSRKIRAASQSIGRPPSGSGLMVCCSDLMPSSACVGDSPSRSLAGRSAANLDIVQKSRTIGSKSEEARNSARLRTYSNIYTHRRKGP